MTTKKDTNLVSDEQLDLLSGGAHYTDFSDAHHNFQPKPRNGPNHVSVYGEKADKNN